MVNSVQKSKALYKVLRYKSLYFNFTDLGQVSEFLTLNNVEHALYEKYLLIHPTDDSALNRFAKRLQTVSAKIDIHIPTGQTQLIFRPDYINRESGGFFKLATFISNFNCKFPSLRKIE